MKSFVLASLALLQSAAAAPQAIQYVTVTVTAPAAGQPTAYQWNLGAQTEFPIHPSCNATERALLTRGLADARAMAQQAKDHILVRGSSDAHVQKYFGNASTAEAIGWYDRIINADKTPNWMRCDDPDDICTGTTWGGYWRGANASEETNICPISFNNRKTLDGMCGWGYNVANGALNVYWASDLIHRYLHLPNIVQGVVDHYADDYDKVLELAQTNPNETTRNSETLQYFALDVYGFDIALPGEGCAGSLTSAASSATASETASLTACQTQANGMVMCQSASATASQSASGTSSASESCHTHSDGFVHC